MQQSQQQELRASSGRRSIYMRGALVILASLVLGILVAQFTGVTLAKILRGDVTPFYLLVLMAYSQLVLFVYLPRVASKKIRFSVWILDQTDVGHILTITLCSYLTFGAPWGDNSALAPLAWAGNVSIALLLLAFTWWACRNYIRAAEALT